MQKPDARHYKNLLISDITNVLRNQNITTKIENQYKMVNLEETQKYY